MTDKLQLRQLEKSFGAKKVLQGITLDIQQGETFVIIGGSGSGKSVLLKCVLGLMEPSNGKVLVDGQVTTHLHGRARMKQMQKFGMLFQAGALFDSLSVWENVAFVLLENQKMRRRKAKDIAINKLAQVGLDADVADLMPAELSGGMRKRVGLARAICHEPEIIFYDEPTTGLDPITADVINNLILKLQKDLGVTSIVITHNMQSAYKIGNRIGMLYEGKILETGTPDQIQKSDNPYVVQFINGSSTGPIKMNVKRN